ncbi:hypothetical protein DFJ73DRAFT_812701 [Zopfochytrium polystomum]|nr:hypothetical protein DFJ73DRAFT_812701 [Zopfochytrium polystomum]
MPRNPVSFEQLDRLCAPTWARFRFFDLSEASYSCASELPHSTVARFHKKHVIFTGLIDQAKLAGRLQNASLEIEVHDRDYKPLQDLLPVDEFIVHENPFGVACFDLSAAATDPSEHRMSAPILPGPRLPGIPPGLWLESGALLHVKVQIKFPLTKLNSERRSSAEEFGYSRCLCLLPKWSAATSSSLNDSILRRTSRKEELLEKSDNVVDFCDDKYGELGLTRDERVSGFVFLDEEWTIFAAESAKETIKELLNGLEDSEAACFTSNSSSSERQWNAGAEPALQYFKVHPTLHQIFKNAKTYIKGHIPTGCFTFLMLLNKLINFNYIHRNQARSDLPTYEMLNTFAEAFGQELTGGPDFWTEQSNVDEQITVSEAKAATAGPITKRVDDRNLVFEDWLSSHQNNHVNVIQQYKSKFDSVRTKPRRRDRESHDVNNYSIQRNSVTARRMAELQRRMKKDHCYLYSDFFDLTLPFPEN